MISVVVVPNPFEPHVRDISQRPAGTTVRDIVGDPRGRSLVACVDGTPRLRATWDEALPAGSTVQVLYVVGGGGNTGKAVNYGLIVVGAALAVTGVGAVAGYGFIAAGVAGLAASLIPHPEVPKSLQHEQGSPTYSVNPSNRIRLGDPVPVLYGRHRIFPDLIAAPWAEYLNDDQYLCQVFCLGWGQFSIETLRIADVVLGTFANVAYEVVPPGGTLTLFRDLVSTSTIVAGQTMRGTNRVTLSNAATNPILTIVASTKRFTSSIAGAFTGVALTDTVTFSNCANAGTYTPTAINSDWIEVSGTVVDETALASGALHTVNPSGTPIDLPLWAAGSTSFSDGTNTITDLGKRFKEWKPGETFGVTGTLLNNRTFAIASVAEDGSAVTTVEAVTLEANTQPVMVLSSAGWVGPFAANPPGTTITAIGLDVVCPQGLHTNGGNRTTAIEAEGRQISDAGVALTSWVNLTTQVITRAKLSPVRISVTATVASARWEVRMRRTNDSSSSSSTIDETTWGGLRGFRPQVGRYDGVTVVALRVKATGQIPADAARQFNVVAMRMIPTWNGSSWSVPSGTRSIAWALADALRSNDYGAGLADNRIDLPALLALDALWTSRGDTLDGVFDQTVSLWDALEKMARVGRATPLVLGGICTVVRDGPKTLRTAAFGPQQMLAGSLGIEYRYRQADEADGVQLAWIDPSTWQQAHVSATVSGAQPLRPTEVDLFGCTNLPQAQREATHLARVDAYARKTIRFSTELDGHLVQPGDLIAISHDVPSWGQSGDLVGVTLGAASTAPVAPHIVTRSGSTLVTRSGSTLCARPGPAAAALTTLRTSEALVWTPSLPHYIALRRPNGSLAGPYAATAVAGDPRACTITATLDFTPRPDLSRGEPTPYLFGPGTAWAQDAVVVRVAPRDEHTVEITCAPYDPRVYAAGT